MLKNFMSQFENPQGIMGRLVGQILYYENRERNAWAVSLLDVQPKDRVLEIGFGPGDALQRVCALNTQGFTAGIDHSVVMVEQAKERNKNAVREMRLEVREGSAMALPYDDASFDKAFTINSLHIWPDALKGLMEMKRVLRQGGLLLIVEQPRSVLSEEELSALIQERTQQLNATGLLNITVETHPMKTAPVVAWLGTS
ncbi:MAG: class I SAM-dependent methyltransferase [Anaerolineae bacterium]